LHCIACGCCTGCSTTPRVPFWICCSPAVERMSRSAIGCCWSIKINQKNSKAPLTKLRLRGKKCVGPCVNESVVNKSVEQVSQGSSMSGLTAPPQGKHTTILERGVNPFMLDPCVVHPIKTCRGDLQSQGIPKRLKKARPRSVHHRREGACILLGIRLWRFRREQAPRRGASGGNASRLVEL
jgi:hypothetical protein